eukprot:Amastigsp_a510585_31.p3 type:complete len:156 gc:universal Amastigsp_a510585_31:534-67(-)
MIHVRGRGCRKVAHRRGMAMQTCDDERRGSIQVLRIDREFTRLDEIGKCSDRRSLPRAPVEQRVASAIHTELAEKRQGRSPRVPEDRRRDCVETLKVLDKCCGHDALERRHRGAWCTANALVCRDQGPQTSDRTSEASEQHLFVAWPCDGVNLRG